MNALDGAPSPPVLEIKNLSVALPAGADRPFAVEDVSLELRPREILCVVGESGSGKSVTSFTVMGLLAKGVVPTHGEIWFDGRDLLKASAAKMRMLRGRRLAMIFQEPMTALSPTMSVGAHIEEVLRIHTRLSRAERRERTLDLMRRVNLPAPEMMIARYPHELSGGQRQRIMIAMALALDPAVLIADEPTTALDVTTQAQILDEIKQLQKRSDTGVLFVTHDFGVVAEIADRVVVMRSGRIVEQGPVADVLGAPQHPYTQSLLAAIPGVRNRATRPPRPDAPTLLKIEGLSKTYVSSGLFRRRRTTVAVEDVALTVRRGETLSIVGESGSGKSTVARCICRLIEPTSGGIAMDGEAQSGSAKSLPLEQHRLVQVIFQDPNRSLNPRWTVGQSLLEGMRNLGIPSGEAHARAAALMEKVGLDTDGLKRYPHEFSGGQRQRICIARALSMEPRLLIADEAVSALDVSVQAQVLQLLARIQNELDLGLLFITHDLRVAVQISDTIAVMHKGRIVEHGPALDVFFHPKHEYSRQLFKAAPGQARFGQQPETVRSGSP